MHIMQHWYSISRNAHHITLILFHHCCVCYSCIPYHLFHLSLQCLNKIRISLVNMLTNITDEISKKSKHAVLYFGSDNNSSRFTNEQNQLIKTRLIHLRASFSEDACLLSPDHSFEIHYPCHKPNCGKLWKSEHRRRCFLACGCMEYQFGTRNPNYSC